MKRAFIVLHYNEETLKYKNVTVFFRDDDDKQHKLVFSSGDVVEDFKKACVDALLKTGDERTVGLSSTVDNFVSDNFEQYYWSPNSGIVRRKNNENTN
jgi:hypothetical protein